MNNDGMGRTQKLSRDAIPTKTIPLVCSWCNKIYRIERWQFQENQRTGVSHGICPDCLASMHGQLGEEEAAVQNEVECLCAEEEQGLYSEDAAAGFEEEGGAKTPDDGGEGAVR